MTWPPSVAEVILLITNAGTTLQWWFNRRDKHSELTQAKEDADKTVRTLTDAITEKNRLLAEKDQVIDRKDQRIAHLETLLFGAGSPT